MSYRVATHDLGHSLPRTLLALPERYQGLPPPRGTPPGFGLDFWRGSKKKTVREFWECVLKSRSSGEPRLRVRTTLEGALLGVYDGRLTSAGRVRAVREEDQAAKERIEGFAEHHTCREALEILRDLGMCLHFTKQEKVRTITRPPLLQIFWSSMVYAAHLVYALDVRAPGHFGNWHSDSSTGDRVATHRISAEELLGGIDGARRLDWWVDLSETERGELALHILREANEKAQHPPPWEWWAGTMARSAGWVCRDEFTGWLRPVAVRAWDRSKRSGLKTAVDRFVRPRDAQEDLFARACDRAAG